MKELARTCPSCGLCIQSIDLFKDLSDEDKMLLMNGATHINLTDGRVLFEPDDPAHSVFVVKSGKIKLSNVDEEGEEYIYAILSSGETLGEELIFTEESYNMMGTSLGRSSICKFTRDQIMSLIRERPEFTNKLIETLGRKLRESREDLRIRSIPSAKERLEQYLVHRHELLGGRDIELSRETIASSINLSRETVSRKLMEIEAEGTIELTGYKKIRLLHPEKIKQL